MKVNNCNSKIIAGIRGMTIWNIEMNKAVYSLLNELHKRNLLLSQLLIYSNHQSQENVILQIHTCHCCVHKQYDQQNITQ